jgi:hypothetical protein
MVFDKSGAGYNVEAMSTRNKVTPLQVAQKRPEGLQLSSEKRLKLAQELLQKPSFAIDNLIAVTRTPPICTHSQAPFFVESCGAAIMQPKTGKFWAVGGLPDENEYEEFLLLPRTKESN